MPANPGGGPVLRAPAAAVASVLPATDRTLAVLADALLLALLPCDGRPALLALALGRGMANRPRAS
jgi:hypothetical protein